MAKGKKLKGVEATLYEPTEKYRSWRISYTDRTTGDRKTTSGGKTEEEAEAKARALCGEYVEGSGEAPTLQEVVDDWLASNRARWSTRTYDHYGYIAQRFIRLYAQRPVNRISPKDVSVVDVAHLSRGEQEKTRTVLRSILRHAIVWLNRDPAKVEAIANGVVISGSASGKRNPRVAKGDIPSSRLVSAIITTACHTLQVGPLDHWFDAQEQHDPKELEALGIGPGETSKVETTLDPLTGEKSRPYGQLAIHPALGMASPTDYTFLNGLPLELTQSRRRGIPNHYRNPAGRRQAETLELAGRYRQIGLATALGAGGGLRIGEVLALRVRHFLTPQQVAVLGSKDWRMGGDLEGLDPEASDYQPRRGALEGLSMRGIVDVSEQASQASKGKIWITGTKGIRKSRTVHLPAFLPNWNGFGIGTQRAQIASVVPRFGDESISLWDATEEEAIQLWAQGFTPLGYLLWQRLRELWLDPTIRHLAAGPRVKEFRELLLFPTRNKARKGRDGRSHVLIEPNWPKSIRIVEGAGTYQGQSNYAQDVNPLYDFVAEQFDEWPEHRTNVATRQGWTHHGFRHWAVSSRIQAGVPLPLIAEEMGHFDPAFTLERYGHVMDKGVGPRGFEY